MLFLFGTKNSTLKNKYTLENCNCPSCNEVNTLISGTIAAYFHLFFIPVFPTSKKNIAICNHCKTKFSYDQFTDEMRQSFDEQNSINPNSTPIWHGCGCLIIVLAIFFFIILMIIGWFNAKNEPLKPKDKRELFLKEDLSRATRVPKLETDSTSFYIKDYIDYAIENELDKNNIRYFSKTNGNKILILLDIDDIKKIKVSDRYMILSFVNSALDEHDGYESKKLYIGINGRWNMVMVSAPNFADVEGRFADEAKLYPFYDKFGINGKVKEDDQKGK